MSDKEEDIILSSGYGAEENELSKEERLEAARKKFEELKKKKKKKKSKKSKDKSEEPTSDNETKEGAEKLVVNEVANQIGESGSNDVNEDAKLDPATIATEASLNPPSELDEVKESESAPEVIKEIPMEISNYTSEEITAYKEEIETLKATILQQTSTIKKLRDENTDLKLSQMDLNDKILELQGAASTSNNPTSLKTEYIPPKVALKKAQPIFTTNEYASDSQPVFDTKIQDFRERLMVWKGWQVNMTNWKGNIQGEKIAF